MILEIELMIMLFALGLLCGGAIMYYRLKRKVEELEDKIKELQDHIDSFTLRPDNKYILHGLTNNAPASKKLITIKVHHAKGGKHKLLESKVSRVSKEN